MTPEAKKRLEEMGGDFCVQNRFDGVRDGFGYVAFMAGAQAAWDLAVKAERERCIHLLSKHFVREVTIQDLAWAQSVLNPEEVKT